MDESNIIRIPRDSISITLFDDWRILKKGEAEDDNFNDLEGVYVGSGFLYSFDDNSNRLFKSNECDQVPIDLEDVEIIKELDIVKGCAYLNEKQLKRISIEFEYWRKDYNPGEKYSLVQSKYLRKIIEIFRVWYKFNEIEFPVSDQLETEGEIKEDQANLELIQNKENDNIFRKQAGIYEVRFMGGDTILLKKLKGMGYLWELLQKPNIEISTEELLKMEGAKMTIQQAEEQGLSIRGTDNTYRYDDNAIQQMKYDAAKLLLNKEEFEKQGNDVEAKECAEEIARINKAIQQNKYSVQDESKKKQNAIRKALTDTYVFLKTDERTGTLSEHLRESITGGVYWCYKPKNGIEWEIE